MGEPLDDKVVQQAVHEVKIKSEALQSSVDELVQLLERRSKRKEHELNGN